MPAGVCLRGSLKWQPRLRPSQTGPSTRPWLLSPSCLPSPDQIGCSQKLSPKLIRLAMNPPETANDSIARYWDRAEESPPFRRSRLPADRCCDVSQRSLYRCAVHPLPPPGSSSGCHPRRLPLGIPIQHRRTGSSAHPCTIPMECMTTFRMATVAGTSQ